MVDRPSRTLADLKGLAQAVLLRATRVSVHLEGEEPQRYRKIFRAARFHGLLHVVHGSPEKGYTIDLDGPFSLFDAVQRYGFRLALFLPTADACTVERCCAVFVPRAQ